MIVALVAVLIYAVVYGFFEDVQVEVLVLLPALGRVDASVLPPLKNAADRL